MTADAGQPVELHAAVDIAVIGAGAAGLMAGIWAGRSARSPGHPPVRIALLDGARRLGAKILVAGGGRCNVTHHRVDETAYAGSSRNAIRKVLGRFGVDRTVAFFSELGVELKQEETGKLFPVTDDAHTVLDALLAECKDAGAQLVFPWRVATITRDADGFRIQRAPDTMEANAGAQVGAANGGVPHASPPGIRHSAVVHARRVVLAPGGMALPKTGSDGQGYSLARSLGHSTTPRIFPALVPLTLDRGHFLCSLSGITLNATVELRSATGKRLVSFTNSTLLAHFGLSGPSILDISRYYTAEPNGRLFMCFIPGETIESFDGRLAELGRRPGAPSAVRILGDAGLPDRLARALCDHAKVDAASSLASLGREARRRLAAAVTELELSVTGDRGFTYAEVTAGGVPLNEVHLDTMASRACPGLFLCGEILDVDGRIGGFNFQWAWATGFVAGSAATASLDAT
ncbi:MAG: flavoprotein [Phycisphaerae bacterium]